MLVYWQNTVQLICYESSDPTAALGSGSSSSAFIRGSGGAQVAATQRTLPVDHNFSFHKVAMDSYALNWRQGQRSD